VDTFSCQRQSAREGLFFDLQITQMFMAITRYRYHLEVVRFCTSPAVPGRGTISEAKRKFGVANGGGVSCFT
jgi:hypothetical protein